MAETTMTSTTSSQLLPASKRAQRLIILVLIVACVINVITLFFLFTTFEKPGSTVTTDFHPYWYAGQFLRQGINPYEAHWEERTLPFSVSFIDGTSESPEQQTQRATILETTPGNTAPYLLLTTPFAFLPYPTAVIVWLVLNILLGAAIPFVFLRYMQVKYAFLDLAFLFLLLFSLNYASRGALSLGQTTFLILFLMILSLLLLNNHHNTWAGILLGIALSKYSLAFPIFILVLLRRNWYVAMVALLTQVAGVLVLSLVTGTSPLYTFESYVRLLLLHSAKNGTQISGYLPAALATQLMNVILVVIPVGILAFPVLRHLWRSETNNERWLVEPSFLAALMMMSLLAVYHQAYDSVIVIIPFTVLTYLLFGWTRPPINPRLLIVSLVLIWVILFLPGAVFRTILGFEDADNLVVTAASIILLGFTLIASRRFSLPQAEEQVQREN
jgi:hypothetical protein